MLRYRSLSFGAHWDSSDSFFHWPGVPNKPRLGHSWREVAGSMTLLYNVLSMQAREKTKGSENY